MEKEEKAVDNAIGLLKEKGIDDIVILTMKTEASSVLSHHVANGLYNDEVKFSTCRKFKGLEADAIILIDLDAGSLMKDENKLGYVGASRARHELFMIASMNEEDCKSLLELKDKKPGKNPGKTLAAQYNSKLIQFG